MYLRVSTKEQATTQSLDAQRKACTEYCRQHGLELVKVFRDAGESAKTAHRHEFRVLLDFCKQNRGRVQYLVVQDLSRFSRNTHDHEIIRALLLGLGVRLRSCREPIDESATGKLTEHMIAAVAQFENDLKSERTIERMKAAAIRGRYMWKAPVGYLNGTDTSLVRDTSKAPLVRQAFELSAMGCFSKREVLDKVSALGLTSRHSKPLTPQSFGNMLKNQAYCGRLVSPRWGLVENGDWDPLVSVETFDRVQAILAGKHGACGRRKRDREDFPLRRFVRCAQCEKPVTGSWLRREHVEESGVLRSSRVAAMGSRRERRLGSACQRGDVRPRAGHSGREARRLWTPETGPRGLPAPTVRQVCTVRETGDRELVQG